jgi:hypothetical protein
MKKKHFYTPCVGLSVYMRSSQKRERKECTGSAEVGGWRRKTHEWLFNVVSGTGAKKDNRFTQDNRFSKAGGSTGGSGAPVRMAYGQSGSGYGSGKMYNRN